MSVRYRAFLSYSHKDAAFARTLHKSLENWRIAPELVGRETNVGVVPPKLRPIFRDRDDFAGGASLKDATLEALENSEFLVVLCSPNAAQSQYVDAEVRAFKQLGRAHRVIPVIIAGEPGSPDNDCFPLSVVREVDEDGALTGIPVEPIAADAREEGDGRHRATAKTVAGLLGLTFDEIARREEKAQRRRTRIVSAVAMVTTVLAILSGYLAWLADSRRDEAERNYLAARSAADSLLGDIGGELIAIKEFPDQKKRQVLERAEAIYDRLLETTEGDLSVVASRAEAQLVFAVAFDHGDNDDESYKASQKARAGFTDLIESQPSIARWRTRRAVAQLISLYAVSDGKLDDDIAPDPPSAIRELALVDIAEARRLGGINDELLYVEGMLSLYESSDRFRAGDYDTALRFATKTLQSFESVDYAHIDLSWANGVDLTRHVYRLLADIHLARGELESALEARRQEIEHIKLSIAQDPTRTARHKELRVAYESASELARGLSRPNDVISNMQKAAVAGFAPDLLWSKDVTRLAEIASQASNYAENALGLVEIEDQRISAIQWYYIVGALRERLIQLGEDEREQSLSIMRSLDQLEWLHFKEPAEREIAAHAALSFARKLADRFPEERIAVGYALIDLAEVLSGSDHGPASLPLYQEAVAVFADAPLAGRNPSQAAERRAFSLMRIAMLHSLAGDIPAAKASVQSAVQILEAGIEEYAELREPLVIAMSQIAPHQPDPLIYWGRIMGLLKGGEALTETEVAILADAESALEALDSSIDDD